MESPLLEVITVRHDDSEDQMKRQSVSSNADSISCSSDDELEIIANFIENVDVKVECDSVFEGHNVSSESSRLSWSTRSSSLDSASSRYAHQGDAWTSADASPLHIVQKKGEFHARLRHTRELVEHQGIRRGKHSRHKSIIQDMIDMSLGKKKVQSSEKMLRTAFIEFYRGLGLLKSYRLPQCWLLLINA